MRNPPPSTNSSTTSPLISVVVACWNVEKYISKCIDSLLAQSYKNLELILVDDCSTDLTAEILDSYSSRDSRIQVIHRRQNGGLGECRNTGILLANGELITFVDGDDTLEANAYEEVIKHYSQSIDVYWIGINVIYESHHELQASDQNYYAIRHSGIHTISLDNLLDYDCSCCNKVFNRNKTKKDLIFSGKYYEDACFYMKFFAIPRKIYFIPKKLYNYYRHPISIMANTFNKKSNLALYHLFILDDIREFWLNNNLLPSYRLAFQRIISSFFRFAYKNSPAFERARVVSEIVTRLRKWNIGCEMDPILGHLQKGEYTITFGLKSNSASPIMALPPLKGKQKFFVIRAEAGHQVIRLFSIKIASRKIQRF